MPSPETFSADRDHISSRKLPLDGCRIIIVEDEFVIADDVAAVLREAGAEVIGPAASLPEGMRLAGDTEHIDAAVLNIDLGGVMVFPLADELQARGVRILFLTGSAVPDQYAAIPCCKKPTGAACVIDELKELLRPIAA